MTLEPVIGLEVHVQLKTESKLFCRCSTVFGAEPNSQICPICCGHPGTLPALNKKAVELLVKAGLGLGCEISKHSVFSRKQYFYPDLPKAYQISQYDLPLAMNGKVIITTADGQPKTIRVLRIHLEEDAGKLLHSIGSRELDHSLVDLNRACVPLAECVSEPDLSSPEEAYSYLSILKSIFLYLGVSDCDMEKGSLRCDANVSLRPVGHTKLGTRAEVKNLNSFKAVKEAIYYEIKRQTEILNTEGRIIQETRQWDDARGVTETLRSKEEAHDYRYFPEPDLIPIALGAEYLNQIRASLPELPDKKKIRFITNFKLTDYDATVLVGDKALADYFEEAVKLTGQEQAKQVCNWITNDLLGHLNAAKRDIAGSYIRPDNLAELVKGIQAQKITARVAKDIIADAFAKKTYSLKLVENIQMSDELSVSKWCEEAIAEMPKAVEEYKGGKERAIGSIVGLVMKKSQGKANPQLVNQILQKKLA